MLRRVLSPIFILALVAACGSDAEAPGTVTPDAGATDTGATDTGATDTPAEDTASEDTAEPDVEPDTTEEDVPSRIEDPAFVRMVHVSPDTPTLDIWIDGEAPSSGSPWAGLEQYEVTPDFNAPDPYIEFESRQYEFDLVPEGGTLEDSLLNTRWNMTEGAIYTMWIGGVSGYDSEPNEGDEPLTLVGAVDDLGVPVDTATDEPRQRVRFFHSVIGAGILDFTISGDKVDENLQFTWYSFDEHLVPLGEFTFGFAQAGEPEPLLAVPMEFGQWTTNVWAGGLFEEGEFWFVTLGPDNTIERRLEIIPEFFDIRFLHVSALLNASATDGIDVYRGADMLATATKYGEASEYSEVESGRHRFTAFATEADAETDEALAEMGNRTYDADTTNTVIFFDDGTQGDALLVPANTEAATERVFVHGASVVGEVTIDALGGSLELGDISEPVTLEAGDAQILVTAGDATLLFEPTLGEDAGTILVITNASADGSEFDPALLVVETDGSVTTFWPSDT
ncbi:MAG: hypothetical protein ACJAYU_000992 [Bradymonadia bacterium]|jgi:hypothetical protein